MQKERRCLKFVGYIYLPNDGEPYNALRYYAARTPGRLKIFDEFGNAPTAKDFAFENLGQMLAKIEKARQQRIYKRVKRVK
jgi:hypothetical protein